MLFKQKIKAAEHGDTQGTKWLSIKVILNHFVAVSPILQLYKFNDYARNECGIAVFLFLSFINN
jgi:hypothetical protein